MHTAQRPAIDRCVASTAKPRLRCSDDTSDAASPAAAVLTQGQRVAGVSAEVDVEVDVDTGASGRLTGRR